jgi:tRNA-(ms[2]io[6]A)-hydroxylase
MYQLRYDTPDAWVDCVLDHFETFLLDHAACERKAGSTAEHFAVRYRDKPELIDTMLEIAREELEHFHDVCRLLWNRGCDLGPDEPDPYINPLMEEAHSSGRRRLLDRLLIGSISEYRGCERFALLARGLDERGADDELVTFYEELAADDSRHRFQYYEMATLYFDPSEVASRLDTWLDREAQVVRELEIRPALH